ncbi:DUF106 domain-containing protein [Candidatus Woesearchaeota archaeon]|nr:DUF106 domain-containing protein [Candidatus Woesearchaeota archaeon]
MVLNAFTSWFLSLSPIISVSIVSIIVSIITILIYKRFTNQTLMKSLKDELKELQKSAKELRDKPEDAMKVQKRMMEVNMKYMMQSMRATIITMLPIILIFGWMNAHYSVQPILPGEQFRLLVETVSPMNVSIISSPGVTVQDSRVLSTGIEFSMVAPLEGTFDISLSAGGKNYASSVVVSKSLSNVVSKTNINDGFVKSISVPYKKLIVFNLFGWQLGWLGVYIIESILLSLGLRKWWNVY